MREKVREGWKKDGEGESEILDERETEEEGGREAEWE